MTTQTFPISPVGSSPLSLLTLIPLILIIALLIYLIFANRQTTFTVDDTQLSIKRTFYGRSIAIENLDLVNAKVLNLKQDSNKDFRPTLRTNGIGLPNYQAGWFRLKNKEKALLFVTNKENVVYIPTSEGYSLMLSVENAQGLLDSLEQ